MPRCRRPTPPRQHTPAPTCSCCTAHSSVHHPLPLFTHSPTLTLAPAHDAAAPTHSRPLFTAALGFEASWNSDRKGPYAQGPPSASSPLQSATFSHEDAFPPFWVHHKCAEDDSSESSNGLCRLTPFWLAECSVIYRCPNLNHQTPRPFALRRTTISRSPRNACTTSYSSFSVTVAEGLLSVLCTVYTVYCPRSLVPDQFPRRPSSLSPPQAALFRSSSHLLTSKTYTATRNPRWGLDPAVIRSDESPCAIQDLGNRLTGRQSESTRMRSTAFVLASPDPLHQTTTCSTRG